MATSHPHDIAEMGLMSPTGFGARRVLWLLVVGVLTGPLWNGEVRDRLGAAIPR